MKKEIINVIRILGVGYNEIILDIDLGFIVINSLEFVEPEDVILHHFTNDDVDIEINFDDIDIKSKKDIYQFLVSIIYN